MNVLFLSLGKYKTVYQPGIYTDLLRTFVQNGHRVYLLSPVEKRDREKPCVLEEEGAVIARVYTGNIQKTHIIEKGINTVLIEKRFIRAIKNHFSGVKFDLVLYPTPPITFVNVVAFIKKRDGLDVHEIAVEWIR